MPYISEELFEAMLEWLRERPTSEPKGDALERAEKGVLGAIILDPSMLLLAGDLTADDFRSTTAALIFQTAQRLPGKWDCVVLEAALEDEGPPPTPYKSWGIPITRAMDHAACTDELFKEYVAIIINAATARRREARVR